MNAVRVRGLSFAYPGKAELLRDIGFDVEAGQVFVIAGLSGCGKTTLCHILSGIIPNAVKGSLSGDVEILGRSIIGRPLAETATRVGLVFQNADAQLICTTVEDELAFGLENLCVAPDEIRRRVDEALERYGLSKLCLTDPARLSGGQKRLVAMAAALILNPELLILDEPMSELDSDGREFVRSCVETLRAEGRTILIVEHDLSLADCADRWMILRDGAIAALDTPGNLLRDRRRLQELDMIL